MFVLRMHQGAGEYPTGPFTRREIEAQIEALIAALDRIDGDADAEDDGTGEPSLGWSLTLATGDRRDLELGEVTP